MLMHAAIGIRTLAVLVVIGAMCEIVCKPELFVLAIPQHIAL